MQANFHSIVAETLISRLDSIHSKSKGLKNEEDRSIDHRAFRHFHPSKALLLVLPKTRTRIQRKKSILPLAIDHERNERKRDREKKKQKEKQW